MISPFTGAVPCDLKGGVGAHFRRSHHPVMLKLQWKTKILYYIFKGKAVLFPAQFCGAFFSPLLYSKLRAE